MSDVWYYTNGDEGEVGPLTLRELKGTLATFSNAKDVLVWCDRFSDWKRARDVPELKAQTAVPPPLPRKAKSKTRLGISFVGSVVVVVVIVLVVRVISDERADDEAKAAGWTSRTDMSVAQKSGFSDPARWRAKLAADAARQAEAREEATRQEVERLVKELSTTSATDLSKLQMIYSRLTILEPANQTYKTKLEAVSKQIRDDEKKQEVARLLKDAVATQAADLDKLHAIYSRLTALDPANQSYKTRLETVSKQIEARNLQAQTERDQRSSPERFVSIENFSWSKGGLESIMMATFTIKNDLPWAIKDIEVQCTHSAASGTTIDQNARTIYERIGARNSKRVTEFNMGFIHSQAVRSGCKILRVVVLG